MGPIDMGTVFSGLGARIPIEQVAGLGREVADLSMGLVCNPRPIDTAIYFSSFPRRYFGNISFNLICISTLACIM